MDGVHYEGLYKGLYDNWVQIFSQVKENLTDPVTQIITIFPNDSKLEFLEDYITIFSKSQGLNFMQNTMEYAKYSYIEILEQFLLTFMMLI